MTTTAERIIQIVTPLTDVIELLVLGCPIDDANLYAQTLRNSGMAIHLTMVGNQDELDQFLEARHADVVLVNCDADEIDFTTAIRQIRRQSPRAAFILLSDDPGAELFFAAETGAQDIIQRHDHAHLIYVVNREQQNMVLKKALAEAQERAQELEQRLSLLSESIQEPVAYIHEGMHIQANSAYLTLFGYEDADEVAGLPFMDLIATEDRLKFKAVLRMLQKQHTAENLKIDCVTRSGRIVPVEMRFAPAQVEGEACTQVIITDLSAHSGVLPEELANYDMETGLFNRKHFLEELEERLKKIQADAGRLSLVLFDLVNFQNLSMDAGENPVSYLLRNAARLLNESTYESDLVARYGEHQFALLCTLSTDARAVAERLLNKLQELEMEGDTRPHFVAGLAYSNEPPAHSATDLVHNALQAVGHASRAETPLVIFDESLRLAADTQADVDEQMVQLIDRALEEEGWFVPLYQPVVSLHGNSREHYVVYLRLKNEAGELMQPEAFLPDAEKAARLSDIDRWTIRRAIQELARHREEGQRINFFLNLSSAAINDDSLLLWICDCLREFKAKGSWLTFVAAQHDVMRNLDAMEQLTEGLKKINCQIALSHFSFEQEAVNLAKHLSVDVVYFSTDTAANISRDKEHRELLQSYNEQLQREGMKTVVTHIEEAAQLALLWNIGVDYIQGNFIQEPVDSIVYDTEL